MYPLFLKICVSVTMMAFAILARSTNMEGNEITELLHHVQEDTHLPECGGNTVCAYLQANARGINTQQLCSCKGPSRCPLVWDADDGHSVTQGSDQYKYCHKAPVLETCQRGVTAYSSVSFMSKISGKILNLNDVNHCICREYANYEMASSKFNDLNDEVEIMEISYVCNALKPCGPDEACKVISETSSTYLVNPKCRCPHENSCPSIVSSHNIRRFTETTRFGNGALHMIHCH